MKTVKKDTAIRQTHKHVRGSAGETLRYLMGMCSAKNGWTCWPKMKKIAEDRGVQVRNVRQHVRVLKDADLLFTTRGPRGCKYHLYDTFVMLTMEAETEKVIGSPASYQDDQNDPIYYKGKEGSKSSKESFFQKDILSHPAELTTVEDAQMIKTKRFGAKHGYPTPSTGAKIAAKYAATPKTIPDLVVEFQKSPLSVSRADRFWRWAYKLYSGDQHAMLTGKEVGYLKRIIKEFKGLTYERLGSIIESWSSFVSYANEADGTKQNPTWPKLGYIAGHLTAAKNFQVQAKEDEEFWSNFGAQYK